MKPLVLFDDVFLEHEAGPDHPERPGRLADALDEISSRASELNRRAPRAAAPGELTRVHGRALVDTVAATEGRRVRFDWDTVAGPRTHAAALRAAGAALEGVETTLAGDAPGALALVRPPGHHAEADRAMGFCFFNNVAVAAAAAVEEHGLRRVLVVDPDVHHGNGTQHLFEDREEVLYASSHRFPFYPGTGAPEEIGRGRGAGFTINLPLSEGAGDADLLHGWRSVVAPVVAEWQPELVLVSAGFDTWHADPLGGLAVTEAGFRRLFALFAEWASAHCPGRLVACLEGGYDPAGVAAGVRACLDAMGAGTGASRDDGSGLDESPSASARTGAEAARRALAAHWSSLRDS